LELESFPVAAAMLEFTLVIFFFPIMGGGGGVFGAVAGVIIGFFFIR
jgi:Flp pilus assembly protein protease CpaA